MLQGKQTRVQAERGMLNKEIKKKEKAIGSEDQVQKDM